MAQAPLPPAPGGDKMLFPRFDFFAFFFASGVGGIDSLDLFHPQCTCPEVGGPKSDHMGAICGGRGLETCIFPKFFWGRGPDTSIFLGFLGVREAAGGRQQGQMALERWLTESGLRPIEVACHPKDNSFFCFFSFWPAG